MEEEGGGGRSRESWVTTPSMTFLSAPGSALGACSLINFKSGCMVTLDHDTGLGFCFIIGIIIPPYQDQSSPGTWPSSRQLGWPHTQSRLQGQEGKHRAVL